MGDELRQSARVRGAALDLVRDFAPEEVDLFDELAAVPAEAPRRRGRDDPLAFGVEFATAFAPVAVELASTAVSFLVGALSDAAVGAGKDEVKARIRVWLAGKGAGAPPAVELPVAAASTLVDLVRREGERLGLGAERSVAVANALLASLKVTA